MLPRAVVQPHVATDIARATQAVILRVQALGIDIRPRRIPLSWLREPAPDEPAEHALKDHADGTDSIAAEELEQEDGEIIDGDRLDMADIREPVASRETRAPSPSESSEQRS
jgi:hypothetical protein